MAALRFLVQGTLIALFCLHISFPLSATASLRAPASNWSCIAYERDALLSIKASLWDPNMNLSTWQGDDCCSWKGVRCSYKTGHVLKLNLGGRIDGCFKYYKYTGVISKSLVSLQQLRYLDLSCNNFNMVKIPEFIGSLSSLRYLNLSYHLFSGRIPQQLGNLSKLTYLDLHSNWTNPRNYNLYSGDLQWLSHLSSLKHLDLSHTNLTAAVDWIHELNMLPTLRKLYLTDTYLRNRVAFLDQSNLTALEELDISWNNFSTSIAPNWFWNSTSLTALSIKWCQFHGPLPDDIGSMTALQMISLQGNNLMFTMIPSIKNLCNLTVLDLENSNTSGDITQLMLRLPNCPSSKMRQLDLSYNNVSGVLPNWSGPLTNLTFLALFSNKITGPIPTWIWTLTDLVVLELGGNEVNGIVTEDHLKRLTNLQLLGLENTLLQIMISPDWVPPFKLRAVILTSLQLGPAFPPWLRSQISIEILHLSNTSITTIPDWFWVTFSRTRLLQLSDNKITGTLPATLELMAAQTMVLFNNIFTGTVPKFPRNIIYMDLSRNSFSGTLPSDFGAPLLKWLILYNNSISGTIPSSLCSLTRLAVLDLSGNKLTGEFPNCEEDSNTGISQNLNVVNLNTNNLSGEFPRVFKKCQYLVFIDLSYNKFTGDLPVWMGVKLRYLALLRLRFNMFSGKIPAEIATNQELQFLDLAHNNFSGSMPNSLVNLTAMARTPGYSYLLKLVTVSGQGPNLYNSIYDMVYFTEKVSVLTKGQQLELFGQISYMVILDFSCNSLTGVIPPDIGALIGLRGLNFSGNSLSGEIPDKIGDLKQLESLDLSNNELSGGIPSSMSALTSLSYMNLSYNTLSGKIPMGNQFQTFGPSNYIGNIGLCGNPLTNSCPGNESNQPTYVDHGDRLEDISPYLGLIVGFVFGLWLVFCVMLFKRRWRIAYYMFIEGLQDKIYVTVVLRWANLKRKLRRA